MLRYLLDACVVSDYCEARPTPAVVAWNSARDIGEIAVSVMTLGEIRRGIELLPQGQRRDNLQDWLEHTIPDQFANRILAINETIAQMWGVLSARAIREKRSLGTVDGILLATAQVHGLAVVTRNVRDFSGYDVPIINPWESAE